MKFLCFFFSFITSTMCGNNVGSFYQLLLERGASLEAKDEEGAIPLHDACASGKGQSLQF